MGKRRPRPTSAEEKRMRQWRGCGVLSLVLVVGFVGVYVTVRLLWREATDEDHSHRPAPHGGVIVSVGNDEDGHYHLEAVVDDGGALKLYTFGEDTDKALEIETQTLTAHVKGDGQDKPTLVVLMPMPQPADAEGRTSQFVGKLPEALFGRRLRLAVPDIVIAGKRFQLDFTASGPHEREDKMLAEEEEKLLLTPGGRYTEDDIRANGESTVSQRYRAFNANHDVKPRPGEKICPVTRTKANPRCTWVVGGKTYEFCCPPCIDEFVRRAKEKPQTIKDPEKYVKK